MSETTADEFLEQLRILALSVPEESPASFGYSCDYSMVREILEQFFVQFFIFLRRFPEEDKRKKAFLEFARFPDDTIVKVNANLHDDEVFLASVKEAVVFSMDYFKSKRDDFFNSHMIQCIEESQTQALIELNGKSFTTNKSPLDLFHFKQLIHGYSVRSRMDPQPKSGRTSKVSEKDARLIVKFVKDMQAEITRLKEFYRSNKNSRDISVLLEGEFPDIGKDLFLRLGGDGRKTRPYTLTLEMAEKEFDWVSVDSIKRIMRKEKIG